MRIISAIDSFKGCLGSVQANSAVKNGAEGHDVVCVPVADGGEGTASAMCAALRGEMVNCETFDPLMRPISAAYALCGEMAVIDVAAAIGLPLLSADERNPLLTTTYGVGVMIVDALRRGARRIMVAMGGSSTNDGGMGLLNALGVSFLSKDGAALPPCGASLAKVAAIDTFGLDNRLSRCEIVAGYDVLTTAIGPEGCASVFAPQKGADSLMVTALEAGMRNFADVAGRAYFEAVGSGAAGGIGAGLTAVLGASTVRGVDMVLDACGFDNTIAGADLIVTGEGAIDSQTLMGKTPMGVLERGLRRGIPVVAVSGRIREREKLLEAGFADVVCINPDGLSPQAAMCPERAMENISATIARILAHYC